MKYKVEKLIDGDWYVWGIYSSTIEACYACFDLGRHGMEGCRVTEVRSYE